MRPYRTDLIFDAARQTVLDAQRVDGRDAVGRRARTRTKAQGSGRGQVGWTLYDFILRPPNPVCLLSMLLAAEGKEHGERTQRGAARRKEAQKYEGGEGLYVYDSLDYLCKLKNVVHDIPLAPAVACGGAFLIPREIYPSTPGAVRGVNVSTFFRAKHYSTTTADGDEVRSAE